MKHKVWDITVKDNPNRVVMGENDDFYTTDTEAFLVFNLQDKFFMPQSAMITLENRNDGSLKSEEVEVVGGNITWEMPERYIEHFGNWQVQIVYETKESGQIEKYTSGVMSFNVNSHIGDKKKPSLVEIENWEKFIREGTELIETWEDMEALREENERQRQENYQELLDTGVLQTNINTKLEQLEEEYAPKLNEVTAQLAQTGNAVASIEHGNAKDYLRIKNYLDNHQNTHPKVLHFDNGWNGFSYWMAYTPYPGGITTYENPCIAVSNNGIDWTVPDGLVNPLSYGSRDDYHSDTHLVYRQDTNTLEIWYRQRRSSDEHRLLYRRTTKDGVNWTQAELILVQPRSDAFASPCIIFEEGKYKMWGVLSGKMFYRETITDNISEWTPSSVVAFDWNTPNVVLWHMDVIRTELGLEFLLQCYDKEGGNNNTSDLYYAIEKENGEKTIPVRILARSKNPTAIDSIGIYRSSIVKIKGNYLVYYSTIDGSNTANRYITLAYGESIYGLTGYEDKSGVRFGERTYTITQPNTTLTDFDVENIDSIFVNRTAGNVTVNSLKGGYLGKEIKFVINSAQATVTFKNSSRITTAGDRDYVLNSRDKSIAKCVCSHHLDHTWRVDNEANSANKSMLLVPGTTYIDLDILDKDLLLAPSGEIIIESFTPDFVGKTVKVVCIGSATNVRFRQGTNLMLPGLKDYVLTTEKMGVTIVQTTPTQFRVY